MKHFFDSGTEWNDRDEARSAGEISELVLYVCETNKRYKNNQNRNEYGFDCPISCFVHFCSPLVELSIRSGHGLVGRVLRHLSSVPQCS